MISQKVADFILRYGDAGLDLAVHGPVQSSLVWCGPVWGFMHEFKMTLHM